MEAALCVSGNEVPPGHLECLEEARDSNAHADSSARPASSVSGKVLPESILNFHYVTILCIFVHNGQIMNIN